MEFDPTINYSKLTNETPKEDKEMIEILNEVNKKRDEEKPKEIECEKEKNEDENDEKERIKIILIITRYKNSSRFSKKIRELQIDNMALQNIKLTKLNNLLDKIRFTIDNSQNNDLINLAVFAGIGAIEKISSNFQLAKLEGLVQSLMANEVFLDNLETITIESNITLKFQDPKKRFMIEFIKSMYMTHTINALKENIGNIVNMGTSKIINYTNIFKGEE